MLPPQHIDDTLREPEGDAKVEQNEDRPDATTDVAEDTSDMPGTDSQNNITMSSDTHNHGDEGMDDDNSCESDVIGPHQPFMPPPVLAPNSTQHQQRLQRQGRFATIPVVSEYTDPGEDVFGLDEWNDHDSHGMDGDMELGSETAMTPTKHAVNADERSLVTPRSDIADENGTIHENKKLQYLREYHSTLELHQVGHEDGRMGLSCQRNQYQSQRPLSRKQSYPPHQLHDGANFTEDCVNSQEAEANACGALTSKPQPLQGFVVVDMTKNEIVSDPFLPSSPPSSYTCTASIATPPPLPAFKSGNATAPWRHGSTEPTLHLAQALRRYGVAGGDRVSQPLQRFTAPVYLWPQVSTASHRSSTPTTHSQLVTEPSYDFRTDAQQDARPRHPSLISRLRTALWRHEYAHPGSLPTDGVLQQPQVRAVILEIETTPSLPPFAAMPPPLLLPSVSDTDPQGQPSQLRQQDTPPQKSRQDRSLPRLFLNGCSKRCKRARQMLCGFEEVEHEERLAMYYNNPRQNIEQNANNGGNIYCTNGILQNAPVDTSYGMIAFPGQLVGQAPSEAPQNSESIPTSPTTVVPSIVSLDHDLDSQVQNCNDSGSRGNEHDNIHSDHLHQRQYCSHNINSCTPNSQHLFSEQRPPGSLVAPGRSLENA
ncbi:hypothetical protein EDD21DRAFT_414886 [Dissophora ornata]|nr:hypothetical protein BGZ58_009857 [Dissophora ornata]KAI8601471.1 hypothetical protein EDD21DRAFT_414886 [Dissophora ornata]